MFWRDSSWDSNNFVCHILYVPYMQSSSLRRYKAWCKTFWFWFLLQIYIDQTLIQADYQKQKRSSSTVEVPFSFLFFPSPTMFFCTVFFCIFFLPDCWGWVLWIHGAIGSPLVPWKDSVCLCWPLYNCPTLHKNMSVLHTRAFTDTHTHTPHPLNYSDSISSISNPATG